MANPFMLSGLIFLPKVVSYIALIGLVVAAIAEFRQSYIGRVSIFLNSIFLWQVFYSEFGSLPIWFQWYLNVGTIIGVFALLSYLFKLKLATEFYQICFIFYGSLSILIIIIFSLV